MREISPVTTCAPLSFTNGDRAGDKQCSVTSGTAEPGYSSLASFRYGVMNWILRNVSDSASKDEQSNDKQSNDEAKVCCALGDPVIRQ